MNLTNFPSRLLKLLLLVLTFSVLKTPASAQQGVPVPELKVVDTEVANFLQKWQIPGATVALVKDDKLLYAKGFGIADAGKPMQPDALFRIASLSKPITAMAVMKLVQDGSLCLDDQVFGTGGLLNSVKFQRFIDPRIEKITVKHLLEHTAGWNRNANPEGDPMFRSIKIAEYMNVPAPADAVSIIQYMLLQPLDFQPGTKFAYSNLGYNILGRIIEDVSNLPYEMYVRTALLQPLGINNMYLGRNLYSDKNLQEVKYFDLQERVARAITGEEKAVPYPYGGFNLEAMDAHGGWIASASDLAKLLVALNTNSEISLLNKEYVKLMTTPSETYAGYAKGWFVNKKGNFWHTGALVGSASLMAHLNNGMKWVLLLNARPEKKEFYPELDRLMWNAVSKVQTWPTHNLWKPTEIPQLELQ